MSGWSEDIKNVEQMFDALLMNIPTRSIMLSGLIDAERSNLLDKLQQIAEEKGIFCRHIDVIGRNDCISQIAAFLKEFLSGVSTKEKFKNLILKPMDAIKSLVISFVPDDNTFSLSQQEKGLYKSVNLTQSLTEVFTTMGEIAYKTETPICFFIDEIQCMKSEELSALIVALHRTNQLGYPIMVVGAGPPKLYKILSDEKSYSERLFLYMEIK